MEQKKSHGLFKNTFWTSIKIWNYVAHFILHPLILSSAMVSDTVQGSSVAITEKQIHLCIMTHKYSTPAFLQVCFSDKWSQRILWKKDAMVKCGKKHKLILPHFERCRVHSNILRVWKSPSAKLKMHVLIQHLLIILNQCLSKGLWLKTNFLLIYLMVWLSDKIQ